MGKLMRDPLAAQLLHAQFFFFFLIRHERYSSVGHIRGQVLVHSNLSIDAIVPLFDNVFLLCDG